MENPRSILVFSSHDEAAKADVDHYRELSPEMKLRELLSIIGMGKGLFWSVADGTREGPKRIIELLNGKGVNYLIVGG